jgi:hypothetical protein
MTIVAKPVVDKKFWILQKDNEKIGNIEAINNGYQVTINNQTQQFKTIRMAAQRANIQFESGVKASRPDTNTVHGYPAGSRVHNPVWDVQQQLPLYTKTKKSKSWFAAGWYQLKRGRNWRVVQDPKLISLERYKYAGPFQTKEQASEYKHD